MIIRQKDLLKRLDEITKSGEEIDDLEWQRLNSEIIAL